MGANPGKAIGGGSSATHGEHMASTFLREDSLANLAAMADMIGNGTGTSFVSPLSSFVPVSSNDSGKNPGQLLLSKDGLLANVVATVGMIGGGGGGAPPSSLVSTIAPVCNSDSLANLAAAVTFGTSSTSSPLAPASTVGTAPYNDSFPTQDEEAWSGQGSAGDTFGFIDFPS